MKEVILKGDEDEEEERIARENLEKRTKQAIQAARLKDNPEEKPKTNWTDTSPEGSADGGDHDVNDSNEATE